MKRNCGTALNSDHWWFATKKNEDDNRTVSKIYLVFLAKFKNEIL